MVHLLKKSPTSCNRNYNLLSLRPRVYHSKTRAWVALLGPCFKTGWLRAFRVNREITRFSEKKRCASLLLDPKCKKLNWTTCPKAPNVQPPVAQRIDSHSFEWHCEQLFLQKIATIPNDTARKRLPFKQFQVLFNSLFRVLFIFPSRYLFAIGLSSIFSFRRNLPPA
jgi:hypothetical protein